MMVLLVIIGVIVIVGVYMNVQTGKTVTLMQTTINENATQLNQINQSLGINVINDTNTSANGINANVPVNPLG
jgi:predicted PurR-regulated permease PerM